MLAPIRPRPIIPSCMAASLARSVRDRGRAIAAAPPRRSRGVAPRPRRTCSSASTLDASAPSLLPGWTVGHVLTHLARNADSMVRVLDAAERGEVVERYPGGMPTRNADIDGGCAPAGGRAGGRRGRDERAAGGGVGAPDAVGRARAVSSTAARSPSPASCSPGGGRSRCTAPTSGSGTAPRTGRASTCARTSA